jgi:uncharacterized protein (TIRG00374 family)
MAIGKFSGVRPTEIMASIAAVVVLFWFFDIGKIIGLIASADLGFVALALCMYMCTVIAMAYRVQLVVSHLGSKLGFGKALSANWGGLAAADYTPARAGYFITPLLLEKDGGVPADKGMAAIVGPQIVDFFLKAAGAGAAIMLIAYSSSVLGQSVLLLWAGVGAMLGFCIAMALLLFVPKFTAIMKWFSFLPFAPQLIGFVERMQEHRKGLGKVFPQIIAITLATFIFKGLEWMFFGMALGLNFNVPLPQIALYMVLQPFVTLFQFMPSPFIAGIGVAEAGAAAGLPLLGIGVEAAVAYVLLTRIGTMIVNAPGIYPLVHYFFGKRTREEG